jgi:hypothetical protein
MWMNQFLISMDKNIHKFSTDKLFVLKKEMFSSECPMVEMQKGFTTKGCCCKNIKSHTFYISSQFCLPKIPIYHLDKNSIIVLENMYKKVSPIKLNLMIKINDLITIIFSKFNAFFNYMNSRDTSLIYPVRCIDLSCSGFSTIPKKQKTWVCNICSIDICIVCKVIHKNMTCLKFQTLQLMNSVDYVELLKNDDICNCPKCNILIHRLDGCNKMICSFCDAKFCWVCGFTDDISVKVYEHLQNEHGSYYG